MNDSVDGGLLLEANNIINGDRLKSYGNPKENFSRIADYWNVYMKHKKNNTITLKDVAIMQIFHKISREENCYSRDNFVDIAGYAALGNILAEDEQKIIDKIDSALSNCIIKY